MNGLVGNLARVCADIWGSIGIAQKVSIVLVGLLALAAMGVVYYVGSRPNWQVLHSNLDRKDAAKIFELARDEGVPVRLKDAGRTIEVPAEAVNALRLRVAQEGIATGDAGGGWDLLDNVPIGRTQQQQQIGLQRAMQGELEKMIREMPGIGGARVMLAVPRRQVLLKGGAPRPSASVLVMMNPGRTVSASQVLAIRHLVSSSIENMTPEDVTISDNRGRLLAQKTGDDEDGAANAGSQFDMQDRLENRLRRKVEAILEGIVGEGKVIAMVSADLDFDRIDKMIETYDSENSVVLREKVASEEKSSQERGVGGAVGASANLVDVGNPDGGGDAAPKKESTHKTVESEYGVPRTTEKIRIQGARIKSLSVAVTVARKSEDEARTAAQLAQLRELVVAAVGAVENEKKGRLDTVTVVESAFVAPKPDVAAQTLPPLTRVIGSLERVAQSSMLRSLFIVVLLFSSFRFFARQFREPPGQRPELVGPKSVKEHVVELKGASPAEELPGGSPFELVMEKSKERPDEVARTLQHWLQQDRPPQV